MNIICLLFGHIKSFTYTEAYGKPGGYYQDLRRPKMVMYPKCPRCGKPNPRKDGKK